jgi:DDE family transposase
MRPALEYHDVFAYCRGILSCRITQQRNFTAFVWSILSQRSCTIAAAARSLESTKAYATKRQRLKRFLRWKNITLSEVSQGLIVLVVQRFPKDKPVSVILDTTTIFWHLQCLTAAVPLKGRAIPIAARLYWDTKITKSQNRIEEQFIAFILKHIPEGWSPCLVADRGFGRTNLFLWLMQRNVLFVIRIKHDVMITDEKGKKSKLSRRWTKLGKVKWLPNVRYRADEAVVLNLVITRQVGAKETWYLATNLEEASNAKQRYEQRFQIEETFKDMKHQLDLEHSFIRTLPKMAKLIAAVLVAVTVLLWIGKQAIRYRLLVDDGQKLSFLALALALLRHPPPQFRRSCLAALKRAQKATPL